MRMASSRQAAAGSASARETPVVEACQVLTSLVTESSDRKPVFLAEGGVIALMELLEERSTKVSKCSSITFQILLVVHRLITQPDFMHRILLLFLFETKGVE